MSATKHTSGPWIVVQALRDGHPVADHFSLCDATGSHAHSASRESLQALADKLNAASGHLAVALELDRLCLVLESAMRQSDPRNYDAMVALVRANRAAIAKATGSAS